MSRYPYTEDAERFYRDTAGHELTVLHDNGLYRHLRFKAPGNRFYWFDIVTWPGTLAVRGDIDGFMFTRVTDMFEFFRMHRTPRDGSLEINPLYWSEKVEGGRDSTKSYSEDLFKQLVLDDCKEAVQNGCAPRGLGQAVREEILNDPEICYEDGARRALDGFAFYTNPDDRWDPDKKPDFQFYDTWDWDLRDYDWSFLWACHAIVWGIAQYDAAKADQKAEVAP